jgi:diguanylate cyclase (GGDEF)-like protein
MIDLDKFRFINDNWGHEAGDKVLKSVAKTFKETMRKSEHVYRFGGDEFVILMEDITKRELDGFLHRMNTKIKNLCYGDINVDSSIGVSEYYKNIEETIRRADKAMYVSKKNKEKVTFYNLRNEAKFYNLAFANLKTFIIEK